MSNYFSGIFGTSPVEPMQAHMELCHEAMQALVALTEAAEGDDWEAAEERANAISGLEHEADNLKHKIRRGLSKQNLMLPVYREDLLNLVQAQDNIANYAKKTARLLVWRRMKFPVPLADTFRDLVNRTLAATKKARKSVRELDELFETSFRGAEAERVESIIDKLDEIETETDQLERTARQTLLELENQLPPVEVMFLYQAIGLVGEIADMAERVGRRLESMLAR
jgi:predicted phosphate transport protein (TIGR00153 family)